MRVPSVSIVIPSLNHGAFIASAIESVLSQRYPSLELVVIDGGSSDQSVSIIRSYGAELLYWRSRKDAGPAAALNSGSLYNKA